jgi:hypothetical protein
MQLSQGFIETIVTLLVTALVTGFLIPYLLKKIDERKLRQQKEVDERKLREQKEFEAALARQGKVIEAQVQLLEKLTELLWEYQLLAIAVTYYHSYSDQKLYAAALERYHANVGSVLGKIRAEISKSLRLASLDTYQELKKLYYDHLINLDLRLRQLVEGAKADWHGVNQFAVFELSNIVDAALNKLAQELLLKDIVVKPTSNA